MKILEYGKNYNERPEEIYYIIRCSCGSKIEFQKHEALVRAGNLLQITCPVCITKIFRPYTP